MDVKPVSKMRTCQDFKMCMSLRQACPGLHACRMQARGQIPPKPMPGPAPLRVNPIPQPEPIVRGGTDEPLVHAEGCLGLCRIVFGIAIFVLATPSILALLWHFDKPLRAALRSAWEVISYVFWF
jgi:hypothetical protein